MDRGPLDADANAALVAAASAALAAKDADLALLGSGGLAICVVDARAADLPIIFANQAFLELCGYEADEIIGRNCRILQGPATAPQDVAFFRECLQRGRPFQIAIVNHRKNGEAFRNEIFVSPVRDETDEIVRYVAILVEAPSFDATAEGHAVAALRHQFRNQIQTMMSLVSLLGQRFPEGAGRTAFEDLRARFEAINVLQKLDSPPTAMITADRVLASLIDQVVRLFDPGMRHAVEVSVAPFVATPRRTNAISQIVAELLIDMFRNGLGHDRSRKARVSIFSAADGELRIVSVVDDASEEDASRGSVGALGVMILENLVRALGGSVVRSRDKSLQCEVVVPPEPARR